jgi:anti-anti-sigma regulatory factor
MLRLVLQSSSDRQHRVALFGSLAGPEVNLLAEEGRRHLAEIPRLVLDLDGLRFIDAAGLGLLRSWAGSRVQLRGGSVFIRALLAAEGLEVEEH